MATHFSVHHSFLAPFRARFYVVLTSVSEKFCEILHFVQCSRNPTVHHRIAKIAVSGCKRDEALFSLVDPLYSKECQF